MTWSSAEAPQFVRMSVDPATDSPDVDVRGERICSLARSPRRCAQAADSPLGVPVAIGFFVTNILAAAFFMGGGPGIQQVINNGFGAMTNFALVPIPMFLFMGELFYHTGLATRCFNAADKLLGMPEKKLGKYVDFSKSAFMFAPPGQVGYTPAVLEPGKYLYACFIPQAGKKKGDPHWKLGMQGSLTVT